MSKQKAKAAARKAPKKKAAAKSPAASRPSARLARAGGTTSQITIFLFRTASGNRIRTTPQHASAGPGHVEWTVVNLIDGSDVPVRITWPNGGPWGNHGLDFRGRNRLSADGVKPGNYKYVVHALDAQEDPEIEFPQN